LERVCSTPKLVTSRLRKQDGKFTAPYFYH
jgi:hypothetical protein